MEEKEEKEKNINDICIGFASKNLVNHANYCNPPPSS